MNSAEEFLRFQEKAWLVQRQEWALEFMDQLMQDVARYNQGQAARVWLESRLMQHSRRLTDKARGWRTQREFMPSDGVEHNLWLSGLECYRWGLKELEVYLRIPDYAQAEQARKAFSQGSAQLAQALDLAGRRLQG